MRALVYWNKIILLNTVLMALSVVVTAQRLESIYLDATANGRLLSQFLRETEDQYQVDFIFENEMVKILTINGVQERVKLTEYLDVVLPDLGLKLIEAENDVYLILDSDKYAKVKEKNFLILKPGESVLRGAIEDVLAEGMVPGAQIVTERGDGVLSDTDGRFTLNNPGNLILRFEIRYIGYQTEQYVVAKSPYGSSSNQLTFEIFPEPTELKSVIITSDKLDNNVSGNLAGVEVFSIETIKELPTFLGEVDPVRSLTTLPGVNTPGEVSSGFNVRGGESGQNLILQDGAIIYNPTHLFGFFSAFNPDMLSGMTLYKGGGPAKFGGRVSSVLDLTLKNGNISDYNVSGGIGLISSRLTIEGPIVKDKTSFIAGGRVSYSNWLLKRTKEIEIQNSSANFHDFNVKIFHEIDDANYLTASAYYSNDDFQLQSDSTISWSTKNLSLRWDHTFSEKLSSTLTITNSNYKSSIVNTNLINEFYYENVINNTNLKFQLDLIKREGLAFNFGVEGSGIMIEPGSIEPTSNESSTLNQNMDNQRSIESAVFVQTHVDLTPKLSLTAGLRLSHFMRLGEARIYDFDFGNMNGRYPTIVDSTDYSAGEVVETYFGLEPRISLRCLITPTTSLKASYYRGTQYQHQISNTTSVTPQDYWISSGPYMKPNRSDQFSFGIFKNLKENKYEISGEGFYKKIENASDYIEGADITLNKSLEAGIVQGDGLAYGAELQISKNKGKVNGWFSYTYSRSLRKFDANGIAINNGNYYASGFDQPHNLSLVLNVILGLNATLSANFTYNSGRPITIPVSKFSYDAYMAVLNYSERNEYRIPDYHRLDLSLTIKPAMKKKQKFQSEWVISVFNLYGRKNAYSIYFNKYGMANKVSILGTIFPSVSYNFKF